jgi:hypothetical protein
MRCLRAAVAAVAPLPPLARASTSADAARRAAGAHRRALCTHTVALCRSAPATRLHAAGRRGAAGQARASAAASADSAALDADLLAALNDLSSRTVRAMLSGKADSVDALRAEVASTVDVLREHGGGDSDDDAALHFLRLLDELLQHRVPPAAEGEQLSGAYARAFSAIITAVEGDWRLSVPGQPDGPPQEPTFATWEVRATRRRRCAPAPG